MAPAPPPPYEAAVYRRLWSIVAPYVQDFDLYAACLVCRQWHHIFSPFLWGNPGSKFGSDSDNIYRKSWRDLCIPLHSPQASPHNLGGTL
jgi:hypothetical protein